VHVGGGAWGLLGPTELVIRRRRFRRSAIGSVTIHILDIHKWLVSASVRDARFQEGEGCVCEIGSEGEGKRNLQGH
jgi:hypothetical protein